MAKKSSTPGSTHIRQVRRISASLLAKEPRESAHADSPTSPGAAPTRSTNTSSSVISAALEAPEPQAPLGDDRRNGALRRINVGHRDRERGRGRHVDPCRPSLRPRETSSKGCCRLGRLHDEPVRGVARSSDRRSAPEPRRGHGRARPPCRRRAPRRQGCASEKNTVVRPRSDAIMSRTSLRPIGSSALVGSSSIEQARRVDQRLGHPEPLLHAA